MNESHQEGSGIKPETRTGAGPGIPSRGPGKRITVEGHDGQKRYEVVPADLEDSDDTSVWNPCCFQRDSLKDAFSVEAHLLKIQLNELMAFHFKLEHLLILGFQSLGMIENERLKIILEDEACSLNCQYLKESERYVPQFIERLILENNLNPSLLDVDLTKSILKETILELVETAREDLAEKLLELGVDPTHKEGDIEEMQKGLEKIMESKIEYFNARLKATNYPVCLSCSFFSTTPLSKLKLVELQPPSLILRNGIFNHVSRYPDISINGKKITKILQMRMDYVIHQFTEGVSPNVFWVNFKEIWSFTPVYYYYGLKNLDEMIDSMSHLFNVFEQEEVASPGGKQIRILFPTCPGLSQLSSVCNRFYHEIKILLARRRLPYINVEETSVQKLMQKQAADWNMDVVHFVKTIIKINSVQNQDNSLAFDTSEEKVKTYNFIVIPRYFSSFMSKSGKGEIYQQPATGKLKDCNISFVPVGKNITGISSTIKQNDTFECELVSFTGIDNFAVHLKETEFQGKLRKFFADFESHKDLKHVVSLSPDKLFTPKNIQVGMYVLVLGKFPTNERDDLPKWSRGYIMDLPKEDRAKEKTFHVYFIDFGIQEHVLFSKLRPMPQTIFELSPAFAIPCTLRMRRQWKKSPRWMLQRAPSIFVEVVKDKELSGVFRESIFDEHQQLTKWMVSLKFKLLCSWKSVGDEMNVFDNSLSRSSSDDSDDGFENLDPSKYSDCEDDFDI